MTSESEEPATNPGFPASGVSLGGLGVGSADHTLKPGAAAQPPPVPDEQLELPHGALVAFRKSGGLRFTSRGFVVARSGWVIPLAGTEGRKRHMSDEAYMALEQLVLRSRLGRLKHSKGRADADGYSYEITARVGRRVHSVEFADGAIPADVRRLVQVLQRLMPRP